MNNTTAKSEQAKSQQTTSQQKKNHRFVSTAIPYVNASPHLGFALELLLADVLARTARAEGDDVFFLTGSDDNSLKNALAAAAAGLDTQGFVDHHSAEYVALSPLLWISNNDFLATSRDPRHQPAVAKLWQACAASGDIYQADYQGLYCVGCEAFYQESELTQTGLCPEHQVPPQPVAETNYFFRLSRYQDFLLEEIRSDRLRIRPLSRRNEVLSFLAEPLQDLSISRSRQRAHGWGIEVPGDEQQVVYVWFDALANYISALGYADAAATSPSRAFAQYWENATHRSHVIGKGVVRFHAVYWPAILKSAGLVGPSELLVHGYITLEGEKISKSLGNTISPEQGVAHFGLDALRYYLLRHIGGQNDGDFSLARLRQVYNTELANQLGNLLSRVCALAIKAKLTPAHQGLNSHDLVNDSPLVTTNFQQQVRTACLEGQPQQALVHIWQLVEQANAYVSAQAPWHLAKAGNSAALQQVLNSLYGALDAIAEALAPLLPDTASRIGLALNEATHAPPPLFPRQPN